jgi:predicted transposase YdaD
LSAVRPHVVRLSRFREIDRLDREAFGMAKIFDATTKDLIEKHPIDWLRVVGVKVASASPQNVDLSTISVEADAIFRVNEPDPWIVHLEIQSSYDVTLPSRLQRYNVLIRHHQKNLPVQSIVLLLRPEADGPALTKHLRHSLPSGFVYHDFRYNVVRLWQLPVEEILVGGLATLPLAPLAEGGDKAVPQLIESLHERFHRETSRAEANTYMLATALLMGMKYPEDLIRRLFVDTHFLEESVTYQMILRQGEAKGQNKWRLAEARKILEKLGTKRFGLPDASIRARLDAMTKVEQFEAITDRILDATSWNDLLDPSRN